MQPHLGELFEISTLLTRFEDVEAVHMSVVDTMARAVPLHSEVLVWADPGREPRTLHWLAPHGDPSDIRTGITQALDALAYFRARNTGAAASAEASATSMQLLASTAPDVVVLPLVVRGGHVFGVMRLDPTKSFDESDLVFANTVANQLAIALERQSAIQARQALADDARVAAEAKQRNAEVAATRAALLAAFREASLPTSDEKQALAAVVARLVPAFAELCIADTVDDAGQRTHIEIGFADARKERVLADWGLSLPANAPAGSELRVLGVSELNAGVDGGPEHAAFFRAAGVSSLLVVPIVVRERLVGVLTCGRASARFEASDVQLAEEIAHRIALAIDNARLYHETLDATLAREQLLSIVAHDLRSPLGAILTSLDAMKVLRGAQSGELDRPIEVIRRTAWRMNRLLEDLLDAANIDRRRLSIAPTDLEVAPVVADVIDVNTPVATRKGLRLVGEVAEDLPPVRADVERMHQVFSNIIGNAIKFTPEGGCITIAAQRAAEGVKVSISDTGPGIAAENLPHVFDRYWQASSGAPLGSGLGLFIAQGIVHAHGGKMWVESVVGKGATFCFTLPAARGRRE